MEESVLSIQKIVNRVLIKKIVVNQTSDWLVCDLKSSSWDFDQNFYVNEKDCFTLINLGLLLWSAMYLDYRSSKKTESLHEFKNR